MLLVVSILYDLVFYGVKTHFTAPERDERVEKINYDEVTLPT